MLISEEVNNFFVGRCIWCQVKRQRAGVGRRSKKGKIAQSVGLLEDCISKQVGILLLP